jgi:ketosteroid isomerase-like protein
MPRKLSSAGIPKKSRAAETSTSSRSSSRTTSLTIRPSQTALHYGTHQGTFLGVAPTGRKIHFETVDVMRVRNGKITEHWGVANLFSLMQQLGAFPTATHA